MSDYEKARAAYEAELRRSDLFNFAMGICAGVLATLLTMGVL